MGVQKVTIDSAETIWVDGFDSCQKDSDCQSKICDQGTCRRLNEAEDQKLMVQSRDDDVSGAHSCFNNPQKPCTEVSMLIVDWNLEYAQLTQDALEDNSVFRRSLAKCLGEAGRQIPEQNIAIAAVLKHAWPYVNSVQERREYAQLERKGTKYVDEPIYGNCYSYSLCIVLPIAAAVLVLLVIIVACTHCWYEADRRKNLVTAPKAYSATGKADLHLSSRRELELVTEEVLPPQMRTG